MHRPIAAAILASCLPLAGQQALPEAPAETLARLAAAPGAGTPFALVQRAIWAFEQGLEEQGWADFGRLLVQEERPGGFRRLEEAAARRLLAQAPGGAAREKARTLLDRAASLRPAPEDLVGRARAAAIPCALSLLLGAEAAGGAQTGLLPFLKDQAENGLGPARRSAARQALLDSSEGGRAFVYRLVLRSPQGPRRTRVVEDIRRAGRGTEAAGAAVVFLERGDATWRLRAAEALALLPSRAALPVLLEARSELAEARQAALAGAKAGAPGSRAHVAFLSQQAYVKDFDPEVAQAAYIAKPVVEALTWGTVLDVTLVNVQIHRFFVHYQRALDRAIQACSKPR